MEKINCIICSNEDSEPFITLQDRLDISSRQFHIIKCNCGLIYLNPRPDSKEIFEYYQSGNYDPHNTSLHHIRHLLYSLMQKVALKWKMGIINNYYKTGRLLDVGGGSGVFAKYMQSKGWDVTLQEKYIFNKDNLNRILQIHNVDDAAIGGRYNLITFWHSLEHIHNINDYFLALNKLLDDKGILIIAVPNIFAPEKYIYKHSWAPYDAPRHLYHFNIDTLNRLCKKYGYTIIRKYSLYQDLPYNILLSMKNYSLFQFMKAIFVLLYSLLITSIRGPYHSSSFMVICKKLN